MDLILEVLSYRGAPPAAALSARFGARGGSLGRSAENDLALDDPDKVISRHHADIRFENGRFVYTDVSMGGTWLCEENRLLSQGSVGLRDGDRLKVGDYELRVRIDGEVEPHLPDIFSAQPELAAMPFERSALDVSGELSPLLEDRAPPAPLAQPPGSPGPMEQPSFIDQPDASPFHESFTPAGMEPVSSPPMPEFDFDDWFRDLESPEAAKPAAAIKESHEEDFQIADIFREEQQLPPDTGGEDLFPAPAGEESGVSAEVRQPLEEKAADAAEWFDEGEAEAPGRLISEGSGPEKARPVPSPIIPTPGRPAPQPPGPPVGPAQTAPDSTLFQSFLDGAGITDFPALTPEQRAEAMKMVGGLCREMIESLMEGLRGRARLKSQFRVEMTIISTEANNPLKFSANADDAMRLMFAARHRGFMGPLDAVREGYRDIMAHQMAMMAGTQASLDASLKRFDPKRFEAQFDEGFVLNKKARCWDAYSKAYPGLVKDAIDNLFGAEFARTYEEEERIVRAARNERARSQI